MVVMNNSADVRLSRGSGSRWFWMNVCWVLAVACAGCGTTREKMATEQLLMSDAVDRAVAHIDFAPLAGETVYLDTQYLRQIKATTFVSADYVISSLRQQMAYAGCLLQDNREEATYVVEARLGALGTDGHDLNYGIPPSQSVNAAASLLGNIPMMPVLPEISVARRTNNTAAAKVAVFAYERESREPVWQSGLAVARSNAQGRWILGAGPFYSGSIYRGTNFAGERLVGKKSKTDEASLEYEAYRNAAVWGDDLQRKLPWRTDGDVTPESQAAETIASRPDRDDSAPARVPEVEIEPAPASDASSEEVPSDASE